MRGTFNGVLLKPSEKQVGESPVSRYEDLKGQIRIWWEDRFKVGAALLEIRDQCLYQHEYRTFKAFCEAEYGFKRAHAYRLIGFAEVKNSLQMSPIGDTLTHESQARALSPIPEEERNEILHEVATSGPVTAKRITEVLERKRSEAKEALTDKLGRVIPEELIADWQVRKKQANDSAHSHCKLR